MAVKNPRKAAIIEKHRADETDTGSTRIQIAVLTDRIVHLTEHLKKFRKDHATRRGLLRLVGRSRGHCRRDASRDRRAQQRR